MKVIPPIKVKDMEFIEGNCTREIAERNGAIMANGQKNYYRIMVMKGQGGSSREETWNRDRHVHTCCLSRVPWRHKTGCPRLNFNTL
jgi:hypothetical protein